jgi:NitT/TauT family transport system substrate-binding protein
VAAFQRAMLNATRATADRDKVENALVRHAEMDMGVAKLVKLPTFQSILDPRRIQRVPDLLLKLGVITTGVDAAAVIVPQVAK